MKSTPYMRITKCYYSKLIVVSLTERDRKNDCCVNNNIESFSIWYRVKT